MTNNTHARLAWAACLGVFIALFLNPIHGALAGGNNKSVVQVSNMLDANDETVELAGAGILTRTRDGVHASLHMTGLDPNSAYTVWWIVFNKPGRCVGPCGLNDLISGVGQGFYATGYVTDDDGTANVYAWLAEGPISDGADRLSPFFGLDPAAETGLKNSFKAEIHMVAARSHGAVAAGWAAHQIGTFDGACGDDLSNCEDQQVVVFPAVDGGDDDD